MRFVTAPHRLVPILGIPDEIGTDRSGLETMPTKWENSRYGILTAPVPIHRQPRQVGIWSVSLILKVHYSSLHSLGVSSRYESRSTGIGNGLGYYNGFAILSQALDFHYSTCLTTHGKRYKIDFICNSPVSVNLAMSYYCLWFCSSKNNT